MIAASPSSASRCRPVTQPLSARVRRCPTCDRIKTLRAFGYWRSRSDPYAHPCRSCRVESTRRWRSERRAQAMPRTVVATGGCFDLLHAGHVATLQRARLLGDRLVVLLNTDASVRRLKGPGRPLQPAADRAAVLRSLSCVDDVSVFDDDTPARALRRR